MAGLVPAIHVFISNIAIKTWMPGTRPGMTIEEAVHTVFSGQRQRSLIRQTSQRGLRARQV